MVERLTKAKNIILLILVLIASIYVIIYLGLPYIANKYNFSEKITGMSALAAYTVTGAFQKGVKYG